MMLPPRSGNNRTSISSNRASSVNVLVIRHGERADEAGLSNDSLDPILTDKGIIQGSSAFKNVLEMLEGREGGFQVFSSPLQRAFMTAKALELLTSSSSSQENVQVKIIPGLCACAAAVRHKGGFKKLRKCRLFAVFIHVSVIILFALIINERRFASNNSLLPLFSHSQAPRVLRDIAKRANEISVSHVMEPSELPKPNVTFEVISDETAKTDQFLSACNYAVRETIRLGKQTCVIVTHREAIRDLVSLCSSSSGNKTTSTKTKPKKLHLPYCCVAHFVVAAKDDGGGFERTPTWKFKNVHEYEKLVKELVFEEFSSSSLPSSLPPRGAKQSSILPKSIRGSTPPTSQPTSLKTIPLTTLAIGDGNTSSSFSLLEKNRRVSSSTRSSINRKTSNVAPPKTRVNTTKTGSSNSRLLKYNPSYSNNKSVCLLQLIISDTVFSDIIVPFLSLTDKGRSCLVSKYFNFACSQDFHWKGLAKKLNLKIQ